MSHSQYDFGRFLIKLHFYYVIKVIYFFLRDKFTYIYIFSLGHSRSIEYKSFVRNAKNKSQPSITLFLKYVALYNKLDVKCIMFS